MRLGSVDADSGEQKNKNFDRVRVSPRGAHLATKEDTIRPTPEEVVAHMAQFVDMLDAAFRRYGVPDGLPERFGRR